MAGPASMLNPSRAAAHGETAGQASRFRQQSMVEATVTMLGRTFRTTIHEGATTNELISQIARENGGEVTMKYYPEFNTSEITSVRIGGVALVKSAESGIHFSLGSSGIPMAATDSNGIVFPNGDELPIGPNIRNIALWTTSANFDPGRVGDLDGMYGSRGGVRASRSALEEISRAHGGGRGAERKLLLDENLLVLNKDTGEILTASEHAAREPPPAPIAPDNVAFGLPQYAVAAPAGVQAVACAPGQFDGFAGREWPEGRLVVRTFDGSVADFVRVQVNPFSQDKLDARPASILSAITGDGRPAPSGTQAIPPLPPVQPGASETIPWLSPDAQPPHAGQMPPVSPTTPITLHETGPHALGRMAKAPALQPCGGQDVPEAICPRPSQKPPDWQKAAPVSNLHAQANPATAARTPLDAEAVCRAASLFRKAPAITSQMVTRSWKGARYRQLDIIAPGVMGLSEIPSAPVARKDKGAASRKETGPKESVEKPPAKAMPAGAVRRIIAFFCAITMHLRLMGERMRREREWRKENRKAAQNAGPMADSRIKRDIGRHAPHVTRSQDKKAREAKPSLQAARDAPGGQKAIRRPRLPVAEAAWAGPHSRISQRAREARPPAHGLSSTWPRRKAQQCRAVRRNPKPVAVSASAAPFAPRLIGGDRKRRAAISLGLIGIFSRKKAKRKITGRAAAGN
jgi:hypothetical protein